MDKFFIQNAFKTLDEIENEMKSNKKQLTEDLKKEEDSENLDFDDLADKYAGKIFNFNNKPVQIITLLNYYNNFEQSVWKVVTADGDKFNVKGKDLTAAKSQSLDENLPKDLAIAYRNTDKGVISMKRNKGETNSEADMRRQFIFPTAMPRKKVSIDFANSNYEDITNKNRKDIIKEYKDKKYKLRLLFKLRDDRYVVIMWNKDDELITSPRSLPTLVHKNSPLYGINEISAHSYNKLVEAADKIYVTDEDEHVITRTAPLLNQPKKAELKNLMGKNIDVWGDSELKKKAINKGIDYLNGYYDDEKSIEDSGYHTSYHNKKLRDYRNDINYLRDRYLQKKNYINSIASPTDNDLNNLNWYLNKLKDAQIAYDTLRRNDSLEKNSYINFNLLKYKILKEISHNIDVKFKRLAEKDYDYGDDLRYDRYFKALSRKKSLEADIDRLMQEIKNKQQEIADLSPDLSTEAKEEYERKQNDALAAKCDEYEDITNELAKYTNKLAEYKAKRAKEESNKEDIKESLDGCALRIYTRDLNGKEDFIDDFDTEEEARIKYGDLIASNNYDQVCLVEICDDKTEILMDSQESVDENLNEKITDKRSIGEIVDDILQNEELESTKLTEAKSFNLKDENDIIDAQAYKKVGEESQEELVVVDPSIESKDDEFQPHVGDAILQCKNCKTSIFKDVNDLVKDENSDVYNLDMDCPHCGAKNGFLYIGQVAVKHDEKDEDVEDEKPEDEKPEETITADDNVEINTEEPESEESESEQLPEVDDNYVTISDVDNIKEESFEKLVNPYLTKLYENIDHFTTTNIEQTGRNSIKIEGKLVSKSGKEKLVEFLFTAKENQSDSIVFEGYNKILTEQKNAFKLKGNIKNKELIFESFEYNYNKEVDGNQVLIEGIEK